MSEREEFEKWVKANTGTIFSPGGAEASEFYFLIWQAAYAAGVVAERAQSKELQDNAWHLATATERERCARVCERRAERRFEEHGTTEPDTGAQYYTLRDNDEWTARDEEDYDCAEAIRSGE